MSNIEINKEMAVSTCHISEECDSDLEYFSGGSTTDNPMNMLSIFQEMYGYRILTTFGDKTSELPETAHPELDILLKHAKSLGCKWLVLDSISPKCSEFEKFDW